jgi:hypothetical protein
MCQRTNHVYRRLWHLDRKIREWGQLPPPLEFAARQSESGAPDPSIHVSYRITSAEGLRERLSDRVARDLWVAREEEKGAPQLVSLGSVAVLDGVVIVAQIGKSHASTAP